MFIVDFICAFLVCVQARPKCRGGELGEPGEPDGSPFFGEMICNNMGSNCKYCKQTGGLFTTL